MISDKKTVSLLTDLFIKKGLREIVLSPGSRNAPIILSFAQHPQIKALSITDERSAAFFALGMAQQQQRAVAIACTSGSAVLNYAPAIAEAYYQKIPLLVLTADRPPHLIDVGDGQTIRQKNVYANYIKASYNLPTELNTPKDKEETVRMINRAIDETHFPEPGPVHINIPLDEPLYGLTGQPETGEPQDTSGPLAPVDEETLNDFVRQWQKSRKTLLIAGQQKPSPRLNKLLEELAAFPQVAVMTETTSNLVSGRFFDEIDNLITHIGDDNAAEIRPDLLITFGEAVVSKKIKKLLRQYPARQHWHLSPSGEKRDTYFCLSRTVATPAENFFEKTAPRLTTVESTYRNFWQKHQTAVREKRAAFLKNTGWCDLKVYNLLLHEMPRHSMLHLGNSTPVRYAQLFGSSARFHYFSNRGVSGIDGQVSTAAGAALAVPGKIHTVITGDLGFFYDSNALMNASLPANLKMIVMNNGGGDIFRFIPGPDRVPQRETFFAAAHHWKAEGIAQTFGVRYFKADDENSLKKGLKDFYAEKRRPALLEIFTHREENARMLKNYFRFLAGKK